MSEALDQLERLERLHASGALNDAEFHAEKARLLTPAQVTFVPSWRFVGRWLLAIAIILAVAVAILLLMPAPFREKDGGASGNEVAATSVVDTSNAEAARASDADNTPKTPGIALAQEGEGEHATSEETTLASRCLLRIQGTDYINGPCKIVLQQDGSFNVFEHPHQPGYFAMVLRNEAGAHGYWNAARDSNHAQDDLGDLTRSGACWENANVRICAWS